MCCNRCNLEYKCPFTNVKAETCYIYSKKNIWHYLRDWLGLGNIEVWTGKVRDKQLRLYVRR